MRQQCMLIHVAAVLSIRRQAAPCKSCTTAKKFGCEQHRSSSSTCDRIGRIDRIDVGRVSRENRTLSVGNAAERRRDRHPSTQAEEHKSVFLRRPSVSGRAGRVRGQQLRLFLFDLEEFHGDDRRLQ